MRRNSNSPGKGALIIFFIHPFIAFLKALRDLRNKESQVVLLLFFTLFGYTFIAENESADSYHYINLFTNQGSTEISSFYENWKEYLSFDSRIKDMYVISSYYLFSKFTDNYHFLMAFWAFVFSFFLLKSFQFFAVRSEYNSSIYTVFLVFLFLFPNNIFNINGVRFWTGAWLIVYIIFEVALNKKSQFVLLSCLAPIIHISFTFVPILLIAFIALRKADRFLIFLFLASFVFGEISLQIADNLQNILPETFQNMIYSYTEGEYIKNREKFYDSEPLYARILRAFPRLLINFTTFIIILNRKHAKRNRDLYSLFNFLVLWLSVSNFVMAVPSLGSRLIILGFPLLAYILLTQYSEIKILKGVILIIPVAFSYLILEWLRNMITVTDPYLLLSVFPHIIIKNLFV